MNILIACEYSGIVRDAFRARGHNAISCDVLPSERPGPHIQADIKTVRLSGFDLLIAHPPCTRLCSSGAWTWATHQDEQEQALAFVVWLMSRPVARICIENPVGAVGTRIRRPDQIIQPYQFGHGEMKTTCLWLKNLPRLRATNVVAGREQRCWRMSPRANRGLLRARTYPGIAAAMADQWGSLAADLLISPSGQLVFF